MRPWKHEGGKLDQGVAQGCKRVRDAMKTDRVDAVRGEERRREVMWIGDQNV